MGPTILFTHLKIILLQCFQFSVFSFQFSVFSNNKLNPNGPKVYLSHFQIVDRKAKFDISCVTVAIVICAMIIWKETRIHSLMTILKKRDFLYVVWN